jgi:zinc transporter ZupT
MKSSILIVDDEDIARQSLTDILKLEGYNTTAGFMLLLSLALLAAAITDRKKRQIRAWQEETKKLKEELAAIQKMENEPNPTSESGMAITLGILLDGIPESLVLGISIVTGGTVSLAFLGAVLISNIPEALGASSDLRQARPCSSPLSPA